MILDSFSLKGKTAIVTGCTTGLGQSMALGLAEAGANVVGIGQKDNCPETKQLMNEINANFSYIKANLLSIEKIPFIVSETVKKYNSVDILVNNAGIIRRCDALDFSVQDWDDVLNVNLKTVFFFAQEVSKQFIKQNSGGKIINIASMLSFQGGIKVPSYTASKSAILGLTKALANELAEYNINVNAIAPGYMVTNNTYALRQDPERNKAISDRIPAKRWGNPEDLKGAVVFLSSKASDYVNGHTLAVDGAWLAR